MVKMIDPTNSSFEYASLDGIETIRRQKLSESEALCEKVRGLLYCLADFDDVSAECQEWDDVAQLVARWEALEAAV